MKGNQNIRLGVVDILINAADVKWIEFMGSKEENDHVKKSCE
ncbi:MAG: hypothetical protein K0Q74_517 [Gammaproteobacteria bacterium]|nr:hypothetical protein [Gammaproteobacteria bacterium]